jgi:hypothetical protein
MAITGEAYGGSMLVPGWTNQNLGQAIGTLTTNIEAGAGPGSPGYQTPSQNNYVAWSMIPQDSIGTTNHVATTHGQLTRVIVPQVAPVGHIDFYFTTTGTTTVFYAGLYTGTGVQVAATAESHASIVNTGLTSLAFAASTIVSPGIYYVFTTITWSVQPVLSGYTATAGGAGGAIAMANAGLAVATAPDTADYGVQATLPASLTLSGLTGLGVKLWCGLRA